jgi:hypothetical protein
MIHPHPMLVEPSDKIAGVHGDGFSGTDYYVTSAIMAAMRFSLKWLLGVTAYVALVAGAIGSGKGVFADGVWAVSFLLLTYAAVIACNPHSERQAAAMGFTIVAAAHVVGMYVVADRLPASHFFSALGYGVSPHGGLFVAVFEPIANQPDQVTYRSVPVGGIVVRTANAVATMLAGLTGCVIGALAYRNSRRE